MLAVGSSLAAAPAAALELGDINVESRLGQPLRASIAFVLAPNEQIAGYCVSLGSGFGDGSLPPVTGASVSVANGVIALTGTSAIREPLMSARIVIDCPYTPHLSREFMLFVDPVEETPAVADTAGTTAETALATAEPSVAARPAAARRSPARGPAIQGTRYRVQPGDSASGIAQRIENRQIGLWAAVNAIFEANPDAFIDNDPNKLKAGAWLEIPAMTGSGVSASLAAAATPPPGGAETRAAGTQPASTASVYDGAESLQSATPAEPSPQSAEPVPVDNGAASAPAYSDLRPGDVIVDADRNGVSGRETVVIPDTEIAVPGVEAAGTTARRAPVTGIASDDTASGGWLYWLTGSGIALFVFLLLYGRRLRERFGSTPIAAEPAHPMRRQSDRGGTATVETLAVPDPGMDIAAEQPYADIDFDLSDDSPTEENLALDADLVMGTGLEEGTDMDVNQDFGFAMTTKLDMELPEFTAQEQDEHETDVIPPPERTASRTILETEVLPEDDDYDMSVIVDATKMPRSEDVTERDLKAVPVAHDDQTLVTGDYTISKEVDYEILEQDYEDELTATQALNMEIERAAAELARRMEDEDVTTDMKLATVTELDVRANEAAQNDDDGSDDAAITANLRADDKTVNMPASDDDDTREMATDSDRTVKMTIEGSKVDKRAG